jgi:TFIIF-interacting CTD phosphatase-like protein
LHKINNFFEIVAFNRSEQKYTTVLISQIERKKRLFSYILSEHHLVQTDGGLMKDIARLNR